MEAKSNRELNRFIVSDNISVKMACGLCFCLVDVFGTLWNSNCCDRWRLSERKPVGRWRRWVVTRSERRRSPGATLRERAVSGGGGLRHDARCLRSWREIQKTRVPLWDLKQAGDGIHLPLLSHMPDGRGSRSGTAVAQSIRHLSPQPCTIPCTQGWYPLLHVLTSSGTSSAVGLWIMQSDRKMAEKPMMNTFSQDDKKNDSSTLKSPSFPSWKTELQASGTFRKTDKNSRFYWYSINSNTAGRNLGQNPGLVGGLEVVRANREQTQQQRNQEWKHFPTATWGRD